MNGYRQAQMLQPSVNDPIRGDPTGVAGGYRGDIPPYMAPLETSPSMQAIRFESGAIRKDFGFRRVGLAAGSRVLAIVEHKFIVDGEKFERLVRLYRNVLGKMALEVLTGGVWQLIETSDEDVNDVYLSTLSIQGVLLIADGSNLWSWGESIETDLHEDDFPSSNLLTEVDDTVTATVTGIPLDTTLRVGLAAKITGTSAGGITVVVGIERNEEEIAEKVFVAPPDLTPDAFEEWAAQQLSYEVPNITQDDEITLRLKSIMASGSSEHVQDTSAGLTLTKTEGVSVGDLYTITFDLAMAALTAPGDGVDVALYYSTAGSGGPYTLYDTNQYLAEVGPSSQDGQFNIIAPGVPGMIVGSAFRLIMTAIPGTFGFGTISNFAVDYDLLPITATAVEVRGLNKAIDGDDFSGIAVSEAIDNVSTLQVIAGAPKARYTYAFGDYAIALHNDGDTQSFSWSVNGNVADWASVDSGEIFLVSADSDAIDDLMGFASLGAGIGALFRKRSIMRAVLTGNVLQSIGAIKWIEELGTESPFSIQKVIGGVMFLGFDNEVYILNESGPVGVGGPIHMDLVRALTSNQALVDSAYDAVFHEYILGVPEFGAAAITRLWIFDVKAFQVEQKIIWRTRSLGVQRLGTASTI